MSDPIATYTFLPWLRQGIAAKIRTPDTLGSGAGPADRTAVRVSMRVNDIADFVAGDVQLVGPGDVVGLNPQAIVRVEPRQWATDFEPNYLAFVEFYDEDFPWRYTPARAVETNAAGVAVADARQTKLRPWIFLMVLEEEEFEPDAAPQAPLTAIRLRDTVAPSDLLPPPAQAWAWAHVHVNRDISASAIAATVDALQEVARGNPDAVFSRLVCPRKLKPLTGYHALLIPAFEVGRLAGLGQSTTGQDSLAPSWGAGQREYPVYYRWYFRTGERGDFEYLANLLEPRPADERVGVRDMDMQEPNFGVVGMRDGPGEIPTMGLEGALRSPTSRSRPAQWPATSPADRPEFVRQLEQQVNLQDTLLNPPDPGTAHPDPVISPPLYGRWHARQTRLSVGEDGWVNELNQDPRYRVPAGCGTQAIQTGQEDYMQRAWQQLGDLLRVNQRIRWGQLAVAASQRMFVRHLRSLPSDQRIAITRQVHARVMGSPTTIFQQLQAARLPQAAVSPTFRKISRPRGAMMRKAVPASRGKPTDVIVRLNSGAITAALPVAPPARALSFETAAGPPRSAVTDRLREVLPWAPSWAIDALSNLAARIGVRPPLDTRPAERRLVTSAAVRAIPPRPEFSITEPGQALSPRVARAGARDGSEAASFRQAVLDLHARLEVPAPPVAAKPGVDLAATGATLLAALDPVRTIPKRILSFVAVPPGFGSVQPVETLAPVMAHPVFADPMYKPLRDISVELLVPNLGLVPNNTITLMETNNRFVEAYMVGLNHEMASELLWREYPTDQRGSYFRQFWDVGDVVARDDGTDASAREEALRDITPLHTWERTTALGSHDNRALPTGSEPGDARLVLVIRGDLLKRYPTAVVYAQKAKWVDDPEDFATPPRRIRVLDEGDPSANIKEPLFKAEIDPDMRFVGFDLTAPVAKGDPTPPQGSDLGNPGWFFIIQERPGEPRFGLDIDDTVPPPPTSWGGLAWNHLGDPAAIKWIDMSATPTTNITAGPDVHIEWGSNAADVAYILYQVPVMVAVHADDLLE